MEKNNRKPRHGKGKSAMKPMASSAAEPMRPVASQSAQFESEMSAARAALRDAASALAALAKEEPRLYPTRPPEEPRPPISPSRVIHVHPTGHHKIDVDNLEKAIMQAGPGGTVVLKANDKSGKQMHFNLSRVDELFMEHEVTLKSEKKAVLRLKE